MNGDEPITVIITRSVQNGNEAAFEAAVRAWIPTALTHPGYLGVHMLRPPPGGSEYGAVLKFRSQEDWASFQDSADYRAFLAKIEPLLVASPQVQTICGLESWAAPLGAQFTKVPARWRLSVVTWIGVCLVASVVKLIVTPLTSDWPWILQFTVANAIIVVGLTWIVMPVLSKVSRGWLFPQSPKIVGPDIIQQ